MSKQALRYAVELDDYRFWVREGRGCEALSKPWRLELRFALDSQTMRGNADDFDPDGIIKTDASVVMERAGQEERRIVGVVTEARLSATAVGAPEVLLVIEPRLALLGHRRDLRVHRNQTVVEIVCEVAEALGVHVEQRLRDSYASRPYCVQHRESDLDYCARLLEDEGIFYFFTDQDVLVLGDHPGAYQVVSGDHELLYRSAAGANLNEDAVHEIGSRAALTAAKVTLRDWNTEHPSLDMDVSAPTEVKHGPEWYDFPGEYLEPEEGGRRAKLHADAIARAAAAVTGASTCARLAPGGRFNLGDTPAGADDGDYVVTSVEHDHHAEREGFTLRFEADPAHVVFRPARTTAVPRILNTLTGIVTTSSPDEDIHCDAFGRVKVHFHWDRLRPLDDDCSHWVPVLQDNTGHSSAIPRKDWEVLVHFLEGDPDRPVVLGRVYNAEDPFTEKLPAGKTRSGLKSMTTPSRLGSNEIRFEDKAGGEHIWVHAEKDQNIRIANNRSEDVWRNDNSIVKNDETIEVGNDSSWDVGANQMPTIKGNQSWDVSGDRNRKVAKADGGTVQGNRSLTVGGNHEVEAGFAEATSAKNMEEQIGAMVLEQYKSGHRTEIGETLDLTVGGSLVEMCRDTNMQSTNVSRFESVGGMWFTKAGGEHQVRVEDMRVTTVAGSCTAQASKELTLTGAEKFITQSPTALCDGATDITLKVGDTVVLMKDGLITIKAPQKISFLISGSNEQGASMSSQI